MHLRLFQTQEAQAIADSKTLFKTGMGYFSEQLTKPQTVGYSLMDSPVGLLAWIYEKLVAWTDSYPWADNDSTVVQSCIKSSFP
jgi:hypothetical protein